MIPERIIFVSGGITAHDWPYLSPGFLEWDIFHPKVVDEIRTYILYPITIFLKIEPFYERIWKNIIGRDRPQVTIWRMRISCWITKATNTHSEYVILIAFLLQQWWHQSASVLRYMYIAYLVSKVMKFCTSVYLLNIWHGGYEFLKGALWQSYFTLWHKCTSFSSFHIYYPTWVKCGIIYWLFSLFF